LDARRERGWAKYRIVCVGFCRDFDIRTIVGFDATVRVRRQTS
jgi:hypothetical protein